MWFSISVICLIVSVTLAQIVLPPFRQISHDIQSGPIEINNTTIFINKLYFDGLAPKAYFLVGKGQPNQNGTKIAYSNTSTLPVFSNANITLQLPNNTTIGDIDYLAVWCEEFQISLGHVFTNERWISRTNSSGMILPKTIGSFKNTTKNVSCETITLLDEKRIFVTNFNYLGNDSAQFRVGKGSPSSDSIPVYLKTGGTYFNNTSNSNITLVIINNNDSMSNTLIDFDYLAVWGRDNRSYGHAYFIDTPNDMEKYIGEQFEGFENIEYGLKSGPIIRVNKNTIYITNFYYRGFGKEYFWVGLERNDPHVGNSIPNQLGEHNSPISKDSSGSSFYLTLSELSENEVYFFGIWDAESTALIVKINFIGRGDDVPAKITEDGKRIIRYPKCCQHKFMMTDKGCSQTDLVLDNSIPVYYANLTHLNSDPMISDRVMYVPYLNNLSCPRYMLNPYEEDDKFYYLSSGTLLYPGNQEHYMQDDFCLDIIEIDGEIYHTTFICHSQYAMMEGWRIAICVCVFLSAICLFITTATFFLVTDKDDMRGTSVAGFAGFMGVAFFCLFLTQSGLESEKWCNALGFIFQFFIVSSLIWLDALCYEMYYNIKNYNTDKIIGTYKRRAITYFSIAIIFPLIFVVSAIIIGVPVGLINVNLDKNCFLNVSSKKWLLYSPILAAILIAVIGTIYNLYFYRKTHLKNRGDSRNAMFWKHSKNDIKTRQDQPFTDWQFLVQSAYLVVFTSAFWFSEVITYAIESPWDALDILHALQGVLTLVIVLTTGQTFAKLKEKFGCQKKSNSNGRKYHDERMATEGTELTLMNNNTSVSNP
nr:uncharacterized protein LOC111427255 isoform X1 [Onthophagus taurus]